MNPYRTLGIDVTSDQLTIRKGYIAAVKKYHPDVTGDITKFNSIQDAYELLTNGYKIPIIETSVKLTLYQMMKGGNVSVLLTPSPDVQLIVDILIPEFSYPGESIEFINNGLTCYKIRVKLNQLEDSNYIRHKADVIYYNKINKNEAKQGKIISLNNFDHTTHIIDIPPNTTADKLIYNIDGAGFYNKNSNQRGKLTVIVEIQKESK